MLFHSDNAASVHPAVWRAMQAADSPGPSYDEDALSRELDSAFTSLFGQECAALWVATGTAANCLALASMVPPEGGVVCHREAHIESDECGAPGFFLHGAKLMPVDGPGAMLAPESIAAVIDAIPDDVHRVQPRAVSITQASERGRVYPPHRLRELARFVQHRNLKLHIDGARLANAIVHLGCTPAEACHGADALSFGFVKNGGMNAEAIVFFDPAAADMIRYRRKRAGHLQSKGRYLAAQILALLEGDLWLANARAANAAAREIAEAAGERLVEPVEANAVFVRLSAAECAALRAQGFVFHERKGAVRIVCSWDSHPEHVAALAQAIASL
ncbi:MAG: beta-eliminating lyase-related protein [Novosphingobium sp.]|nr:beta-eliminating lyase-related protein [Novosphingobium sp.]